MNIFVTMSLHDVIQANRKDLQRFLGLNDDNEMVSKAGEKIQSDQIHISAQVYIRNVRKPQQQDSHNRGRGTQSGTVLSGQVLGTSGVRTHTQCLQFCILYLYAIRFSVRICIQF